MRIYDASPSAAARGWQRFSGYGWRALVESDIARWKRVVGDGLRFQTDLRQTTEVAIAAEALNRMLDLGRPEYVRSAAPCNKAPRSSQTASYGRHGGRWSCGCPSGTVSSQTRPPDAHSLRTAPPS